MIADAFGSHDPLTAHNELAVEEYVEILATLKPRFTHHYKSKQLLRDILLDLGADPSKTYFDVPKLRVVPPSDYLSAGLGYNYTAPSRYVVLRPAVPEQLVDTDRGQLGGDGYAVPSGFLAATGTEYQQRFRRLRVESDRAARRGGIRQRRSATPPPTR